MNIPKGSIFQCNRSKTRYIEVLDQPDENGRVKIVTRFNAPHEGSAPQPVTGMLATTARADRFDGRSNGYSFCAPSIYQFERKRMALLGFADKAKSSNRSAARATGDLSRGEFWQELTDRHLRIVEIIGENDKGQKEIITRFYTRVRGEKMKEATMAMPTFAKAERFNGKSSGYAFVGKSLHDVKKSGKLEQRYIPRHDAVIVEKIVAKFGQPVTKGQLWHDLSSPQLRVVEIHEIVGSMVQLKTTYEQEQGQGKPQRVLWDHTQDVHMEDFSPEKEQYNLVKAVEAEAVIKASPKDQAKAA